VADIPEAPSVKLRLSSSGDQPPIWDITGSLRFAADKTRPDILFDLNVLSSKAHSPGPEHVRAARRILKYLKGTDDSFLVLGGRASVVPVGLCDASYTPDGDSLSQYGYCIHLNYRSGANIVKSKKSTTIPHSPCEAEVNAMDEIGREVEWVRLFLEEMGYGMKEPTIVYTDSTAGIDQTSAHKNSAKARHYCRNLNYLRQLQDRGVLKLVHISGEENHADTLTKDLGYTKFKAFAEKLMWGETK
jgi:hypothetical protein